MNSSYPFITIEKPSEDTIFGIIQLLENAGLQVIRTFDLQEARLSHSDCPCPHHGTEACDCQMSVLLIYQKEQPPVSLLIHGFQETTWLYLVDTPEQPSNQSLDLLIRETLTQAVPGPVENRE
jgi:hypothetical protein